MSEVIHPLDYKTILECHASTIVETSAGMAVAFSETHERNPDLGIRVSRIVNGKGTKPEKAEHRRISNLWIIRFWFILPLISLAQVNNQLGSPNEPLRVLSPGINMNVHDGGLRPAIGTENIEVLRSNRTHSETADNFGWTYNHAPMLAFWKGNFYLEYLSNPFGEHIAPGQTFIVKSSDGRNWEMPEVAFPIYLLRPGRIYTHETGMGIMHQRMGFYVAPNGRLLVLGFYGHAPNPFGEGGIGRVVREAFENGSYGPIYFIRYSVLGKRDSSDISTYPFYTHSKDKGFIEACDTLLDDKLKTMQWYEENPSNDGFFSVEGKQAPSVYHRMDGKAVALWKASWTAISSDEGKTWSTPIKVPSIVTDGAKVWGQRTQDSRYAMVYNPVEDGSHRWPLALTTSEDGVLFDNMVLVDGEVPPRRYIGRAKDFGSQYVRGISEGNGMPSGSDMWVTYSVNKEDIWVSRIPVPIRYKVTGPIMDSFDKIAVGGMIPDWNVYSPKWAPVSIVAFPSATNKSLQLEDWDPYNYSKVVRVFSEAEAAMISFKVYANQSDREQLEIEILDRGGLRPVRLVLREDGRLQLNNGNKAVDVGTYKDKVWYSVEISINTKSEKFNLSVDGKSLIREADFAESVSSVERLSFRTGAFHTEPVRESDRYAGGDLLKPGEPSQKVSFHIDEVKVK